MRALIIISLVLRFLEKLNNIAYPFLASRVTEFAGLDRKYFHLTGLAIQMAVFSRDAIDFKNISLLPIFCYLTFSLRYLQQSERQILQIVCHFFNTGPRIVYHYH
jgi:hypothetical protein